MGIDMPALIVTSQFGRDLKSIGGDLFLPAKYDTITFNCIADAESKPHLAAARRNSNGNYALIKEAYPDNDFTHASFSWARFTVKSPPAALDEDEYICSAGSGSKVVSQKFTIKRVVDVNIKRNATGSILMQEGQNERYDLRCEATGAPTPEIRFYVSPTMMDFDRINRTLNKEKEIRDSDLFEKVTWTAGGTTYGKLIVKNFDNVIETLPDRFWKENFSYYLLCYASNEFDDDFQKLAYFYPPNETGSGPMNATYLYNYAEH